MQLFIPDKIDFNEDISTSLVPPIGDASKDDPLFETSHSVMMARSITQPERIDQTNDFIKQKMALTTESALSALLTTQVP